MVPILGADIVVGGQRKSIFTNTIKREVCIFLIPSQILIVFFLQFKSQNVSFPKTAKTASTANSPLPTPPPPQRPRKASPVPPNKTK